MNKKLQIISMLMSGLFIITFSGCDWCGCCKKNSCGTEAPKKTEPKAPEHSVEPEAEDMAQHPMPEQPEEHPMPVHPVAKMPVMPEEPKMAPKIAPAPKAP